MKFQDLGLSAPLLRAIEEKGYETPTPIQEQAIPPVLRGRDLQGCAQTGTGKTAAFTLPILQLLAAEPPVRGRREIRALVLTPTRELAIQIDECCRDYARYTPIRHCVIFGGVNQRPQVEALQQGVDLLVATPGRLLDLIGQGYITLDHLRFFVLDEADRMLDMGFIHDIRRILPLLPERRQSLFFSATMPADIAALAARILHDPELVAVTPPASVVETIAQRVHFAEKSEKSTLLIDLLRTTDADQVLVFTRTKHGADRLARILTKAGIQAAAIHGNKSQNARVRAMNDFKSGACRVLIATDIAARGIDIDQLPLVINYELPEVAETYVHRIGRTGRAGHEGSAWSFCSEAELEYLLEIQKLTGLTLPVEGEIPEYAAEALAAAGRKNGRKTGRKSAPKAEAKTASAPKSARKKPVEESGIKGKDEKPETAGMSEKAGEAGASETPDAGNAPKKRRRKRRRQGTLKGEAATAETAGTESAAEGVASSHAAAETATVSHPAKSAGTESVRSKPSAAAKTATEPKPATAAKVAATSPVPESGDKPRKRRRRGGGTPTDPASGKQPAARPEAKRDTSEASARPKKARTRDTSHLTTEEYEPRTGIERARSRQLPSRETKQTETQKRIPHTNDWKNRVKSLLLRSFRK